MPKTNTDTTDIALPDAQITPTEESILPAIALPDAVANLRTSLESSSHPFKSQIETALNTIESYLRF